MSDRTKTTPQTKSHRRKTKTPSAKAVTGKIRQSKAIPAERRRKKQSVSNAKPKKVSKTERTARTSAIDTNTNETHPFRPTSKLAKVVDMLHRPKGASIEELAIATGWQEHSVRGALAGALKKKLKQKIVSEQVAGTRRYRIGV